MTKGKEELRECPFCGGEAKVWQGNKSYHWAIECNRCDIDMPSAEDSWFTSEANAIKAWNTRPSPKGEGEIEEIIKGHYWTHKKQKTTQSLYRALKHCYGDDTDIMITDLAQALSLKPTGLRELDEGEVTECIKSLFDNKTLIMSGRTISPERKLAKAICSQFGTREVRLPEKEIREYLWINHSYKNKQCCPYGDDGEMQCCGMDFKRQNILDLIRNIYDIRNNLALTDVAGLNKKEETNVKER